MQGSNSDESQPRCRSNDRLTSGRRCWRIHDRGELAGREHHVRPDGLTDANDSRTLRASDARSQRAALCKPSRLCSLERGLLVHVRCAWPRHGVVLHVRSSTERRRIRTAAAVKRSVKCRGSCGTRIANEPRAAPLHLLPMPRSPRRRHRSRPQILCNGLVPHVLRPIERRAVEQPVGGFEVGAVLHQYLHGR